MKIGIVFFTENGKRIYEELNEKLTATYEDIELLPRDKNGGESLQQWVEWCFKNVEAIVFVSATGIAVRSISPFVRSKLSDPAVIVVDDAGRFAISLLSGHVGGANKLTEKISSILGSTAVITTATDVNGRLAIDEWAVKNNLAIRDIKPAKDIAMALLRDEKIKTASNVQIEVLNEQIVLVDDKEARAGDMGINISWKEEKLFKNELKLIPKCLTLGIGCKRGKSKDDIKALVEKVINENGICKESIKNIASIDLKKDEVGLIELADELNVPFVTYGANELLKVQGQFPKSDFVKEIVGVDNVCQRAAKLCSKHGMIAVEKTSLNGVTLSIGIEDIKLKI